MGVAFLLKSGLSRLMFDSFVSDYQSYSQCSTSFRPFVYIDETGSMKVLTDMVNGKNEISDDIFAVTVDENGWTEVLELDSGV